jgi:8-oxo-dGTP pyrophosphatase MutT (NUDIX family)
MTEPVPRIGARLLLLDPADRVLLIHEGWDDHGRRGEHGITPGGGVTEGEPLRTAAVREVWEELGVRVELPADAVEVYQERRSWSWRETTYDQTDHYFAACIPAETAFSHPGLTPMEQETVLGQRWWTLAQLQTSPEIFVPVDIATVLESVLLARTAG